jgi:hypothetical protein
MHRVPSAPTTAVDPEVQTELPEVVPGFSLLQVVEDCISDGHRIDRGKDPADLIDHCFLQLDEGLPRSIASLHLGGGGMAYAVRNCQRRFLIAPTALFSIRTRGGKNHVSLKDHERVGRIPYREGTREVVLVLDNSPQPAEVEGKFVVVSLVPLPTDTSVGAVRTREAALQHVRRVMTSSEKSKQ